MRVFLIGSAMLLSLAACSSDEEGLPRRDIPPPSTGPYVSVAVDNHFHDIHPETAVEIAIDRAFVIKNQGSNLHNVTIPGTEIDVDLKPGEEFAIDPLGSELEVGSYEVVCQIHAAQGMTGEFEVVAG